MGHRHVYADVELRYGDRVVRVRALVDTGASRSVISIKILQIFSGIHTSHLKPRIKAES